MKCSHKRSYRVRHSVARCDFRLPLNGVRNPTRNYTKIWHQIRLNYTKLKNFLIFFKFNSPLISNHGIFEDLDFSDSYTHNLI